jgi:hypothetical protein
MSCGGPATLDARLRQEVARAERSWVGARWTGTRGAVDVNIAHFEIEFVVAAGGDDLAGALVAVVFASYFLNVMCDRDG